MDFLVENGLLVDADFSEDEFFIDRLAQVKHSKVRVNHLRLVLTEKCNYNCTYCFESPKKLEGELDWDSLRKALELLIRHNKDAKDKGIHIHFFGGEPLLKFDIIQRSVDYVDSNKGDLIPKYHITTNGSLIDDDKVGYFKKHNFRVGVSLDGPREVNDMNRRFSDGRSTFEVSLKGFNLLKSNEVENFILITPSEATLNNLDKICRWAVLELKPDSLTVNRPQYDYGWGVNGKLFSEKMKSVLLFCEKEGIKLNSPASQVVSALKYQSTALRTCASDFDTATLVVTADGRLGYCTIYFGRDIFDETLRSRKDLDSESLQNWFSRSVLDNESCRDCIAVFICGGICPMQSMKRHANCGQLVNDPEKCSFFKDFTEWAVRTLV